MELHGFGVIFCLFFVQNSCLFGHTALPVCPAVALAVSLICFATSIAIKSLISI